MARETDLRCLSPSGPVRKPSSSLTCWVVFLTCKLTVEGLIPDTHTHTHTHTHIYLSPSLFLSVSLTHSTQTHTQRKSDKTSSLTDSLPANLFRNHLESAPI